MAGNTLKVYDICFPSPAQLKKLAATAVSLQIWRSEVKKLRASDTWNWNWEEYSISQSVKNFLPSLPPRIFEMIKGHFLTLFTSVIEWVPDHHKKVIDANYDSQDLNAGDLFYVLKYFDDFVCDPEGYVHYARTAKRWMQCTSSLLGLNGRFSIACLYCFENEIKEMWPFVSKNTVWNTIDFSNNPILYYWIRNLRNELGTIQNRRGDSAYEIVLRSGELSFDQRSAMDYFWDRVPVNSRFRLANHVSKFCLMTFIRVILPKLDDQMLRKFLKKSGAQFVFALFRDKQFEEQFVIRIWLFVRNHLNKDEFSDLVHHMLETEIKNRLDDIDSGRVDDSLEYLSCEIWNSAPLNSKPSSIREILSNHKMIENMADNLGCDTNSINAKLLLAIISEADIKDRSLFWQRSWHNLISIYAGKDLQKMMKLCFENDDQITQFKENVVAGSRYVSDHCLKLLRLSHFDKLKDFKSALYPDF